MDEQAVRDQAEALCAAIVAGDMGQAATHFSEELRRNLGEVVALLPLPCTEAAIESIDRGGSAAVTVTLRLTGETEEIQIVTRWKDRDGSPTMIEASHLSRTEMASPSGDDDAMEGDAASQTD
ncbi:MAG: hypothetical protein ABIQ17_06350 [Candidatus Limnocylindrales bacterium]